MNLKKLIASALALIALAVFPVLSGNPYYIHLVETIMIYAILLFGLDIVVGYTGQVSLGPCGAVRRRRLHGGRAVHQARHAVLRHLRRWRSPSRPASARSSRCRRCA